MTRHADAIRVLLREAQSLLTQSRELSTVGGATTGEREENKARAEYARAIAAALAESARVLGEGK